jgi:hypothetical protein
MRVLELLVACALAGSGCQKDPPVMQPTEGELPPLPPASGTAVGYLVDSAAQLKLREDQLAKLKEIDQSLAARNDVLDTQLRTIERPNEQPAMEKGAPPPRHNNAPGAQIKTTPDAAKLHRARKENDQEALVRAFAVLDAEQQTTARRLLEERGVEPPGGPVKKPAMTAGEDDATPLPAGEP